MATLNGFTVAAMVENCIGHIDVNTDTYHNKQSLMNLRELYVTINALIAYMAKAANGISDNDADAQLIGCRAIGYLAEMRNDIDMYLKNVTELQLQKWEE